MNPNNNGYKYDNESSKESGGRFKTSINGNQGHHLGNEGTNNYDE